MYQTAFSPNNSLLIDYYESHQKNDMKVQHYHDTIEIYLQTCGERYLFLNDICHTLKAGDLYILKPFQLHYTESREADYYGRYLLSFPEDKLGLILSAAEKTLLSEKLESGIYHLPPAQSHILYGLFAQISRCHGRSGFLGEKLQYSYVFQLLMELSEMIRKDTAQRETVSSSNIQPEIIQAIHYLNANYQDTINLNSIAQRVHMSKYHFCRLFHQTTGATFLEYLYNIRLTKVHQMLLGTSLSLSDIAERAGFTSSAHLSRVFRSVYHLSPREFRANTLPRPESAE